MENENLDIFPEGKDYFPLEVGRYVSYNVVEQKYELNEPTQITRYQLKEVIEDVFENLTDGRTYKIVRYRRNATGSDNWTVWNVWTVRLHNQTIVKNEENISYVKLVFPLAEGRRWNGNIFNIFEPEEYQMKGLNRTYRFGNKTFEKTVTVQQKADSSLVNKDIRQEVFAQGVGMIYKRLDIVSYCQEAGKNCLGKAIIESGNILEMSVFDYGKQ
jgi:hypothetical protein